MRPITRFFDQNQQLILFLYGLVFFIMGLSPSPNGCRQQARLIRRVVLSGQSVSQFSSKRQDLLFAGGLLIH